MITSVTSAMADDKKVIIITGANTGIGLETAKRLCQLGHDVIVSVRDDAKGKVTITTIKDLVPTAQVSYIVMELTEPHSIREFVDKFLALDKPLHVLINNAGLTKAFESSERCTAREDDSLEITMTANCMGSFLLTNLLLDKLQETAKDCGLARIVNVSSVITVRIFRQMQLGFHIDDLMLAEQGHYKNGMQAYRNSKLALNLWTRELTKKLEGTNVIANTVCPGFIPSTGLNKEDRTTWKGSILFKLFNTVFGRLLLDTKPLAEGGRRLVKMAVGEDTKTCGIFYCNDRPTEEASEVRDDRHSEKIWDLCVQYSGL